jgi:glucokinase
MKDNNRNRTVIGIDLGGTKIAAALFSHEGTIIHKSEVILAGKGGAEAGSAVVHEILQLVEYARTRNYQTDSIGICVPGISNRTDNTVWAPNIPGWEKYPLYNVIQNAIDNQNVQISIESDRSCYILGEMWKGSARGCSNAIFMAVGTGIGIGIVANGNIINGASGISGSIGWLALNRPYLPEYERFGNFEYHASGTGIARAARTMLHEGHKSAFLNTEDLNARDVFTAYDHNDPVAMHVINQCIGYWGMAVANLVSIFNPEKIIFGGGVFGPAIRFLARIHDEARKWAQPISMQQVRLEGSSLKGEAGLIGAGYLAIQEENSSKY